MAGAMPAALALDPGGLFAFTVNPGASTVTSFLVDPTSGGLAPLETKATGAAPSAVAIDPTGRFLYVANTGGDSVSTYVISPVSGSLTPMPPTVAAGMGPSAVAAHPSGRFLYVANEVSGDVSMYAIEPVNGLLASLGPPVPAGTAPRTLAVDPGGRFAYAGNPGAIGLPGDGSNDIAAYTVDPATGVLGPIDTLPVGAEPTSLVVDPSGHFVYVASATFDNVLAYAIGDSGALVAGASVAGGTDPAAVAVIGRVE